MSQFSREQGRLSSTECWQSTWQSSIINWCRPELSVGETVTNSVKQYLQCLCVTIQKTVTYLIILRTCSQMSTFHCDAFTFCDKWVPLSILACISLHIIPMPRYNSGVFSGNHYRWRWRLLQRFSFLKYLCAKLIVKIDSWPCTCTEYRCMYVCTHTHTHTHTHIGLLRWFETSLRYHIMTNKEESP